MERRSFTIEQCYLPTLGVQSGARGAGTPYPVHVLGFELLTDLMVEIRKLIRRRVAREWDASVDKSCHTTGRKCSWALNTNHRVALGRARASEAMRRGDHSCDLLVSL